MFAVTDRALAQHRRGDRQTAGEHLVRARGRKRLHVGRPVAVAAQHQRRHVFAVLERVGRLVGRVRRLRAGALRHLEILVRRDRALDRLDRAQERDQGLRIGIGHATVVHVRHDRVEAGAVGPHALADGRDDLLVGPAADPGALVLRDVRRAPGAHRIGHLEAACECVLEIGPGRPDRGVTDRAGACLRDVRATLDELGIGRSRGRRLWRLHLLDGLWVRRGRRRVRRLLFLLLAAGECRKSHPHENRSVHKAAMVAAARCEFPLRAGTFRWRCHELARTSGAEKEKRAQLSTEPSKPRQRPTLPQGCPCSTIGPGELNFRVRDGNGCDLSGVATRKKNTKCEARLAWCPAGQHSRSGERVDRVHREIPRRQQAV